MNEIRQSWKTFHPLVQTLMVGTILTSITGSMSIPFLAIYLMSSTDLDAAQIGLILGAAPLVATFCGFIGGILSDFFGRRRLILISSFTLCIVFVGFIWAKEPWMLLILSILRGISSSFFTTVSKTLMGDLTPEAQRFKMFSYRYYAINVGYTLGPILGTGIGLTGSSFSFLLTGVIYLFYGLVLAWLFYTMKIVEQDMERNEESKSLIMIWEVIRKDKVLLFFIIGGIFLTTVHGQISVLLSQHLTEAFESGVKLFGLLMSINGLTVLLGQLPITQWSERMNLLNRLRLGSCLLAIGVCGFALSLGWTGYIIAMIIFTFGEILVVPTEYAMIDSITPTGMRGTYYGAQSFNELGSFVGPWMGGMLLTSYGSTTMFVSLSGIALISILFFSKGWKLHVNQKSACPSIEFKAPNH